MPQIPQAIIDELVAHAREDLPNEACGMIHARRISVGHARALAKVARPRSRGASGRLAYFSSHRVRNIADSPYRYEMDPLRVMRLERARERARASLFAIYHSHVASPAYPSHTDIRMAFFPPGEVDRPPMYPGTLYILVSLEHETPSVRAFHVRQGGHVEEEPIEVV